MSNYRKARGTRWESAVVKACREAGFPAYRKVQAGAKDTGDVGGLPLVILECKDHAELGRAKLADFIDQARREARHAGEPFGLAVVKNRQHSTEEAFVLMSLEDGLRLLKLLERLSELDGQEGLYEDDRGSGTV